MEIVAQIKAVHAADGRKKLCIAGNLREDYRFGSPTHPSDPPVKNFARLSGR